MGNRFGPLIETPYMESIRYTDPVSGKVSDFDLGVAETTESVNLFEAPFSGIY